MAYHLISIHTKNNMVCIPLGVGQNLSEIRLKKQRRGGVGGGEILKYPPHPFPKVSQQMSRTSLVVGIRTKATPGHLRFYFISSFQFHKDDSKIPPSAPNMLPTAVIEMLGTDRFCT